MAGGIFNLAQKKIRPGTYANVVNGRQPAAEAATTGIGCIPLIGYDWGPRGQFFQLSAASPDAEQAKLGRSVYSDNSHMRMLALMLMGAATLYVYIPDAGTKATKTQTNGEGNLVVTAKYKGTLGNGITLVSVANPTAGFDVSVVLDGQEVERFEGVTDFANIVSDYVDISGTETTAVAFAGLTLTGGTNTASGETVNAGVAAFLDASEKVHFNCMCFPSAETSLQTALRTKIKYIRETIGWKCQAVAPNFAADYEGIINLTNSFRYDDTDLTTAEACAWLAGVTAGADFTTSNTYVAVVGAEAVVGEKTHEASEAAIKAGQAFFTVDDDGSVILETDINSLVTHGTKPADAHKNRPLRVYDQFCNDCLVTFKPNKFSGDETGYQIIEGMGRAMLMAYQAAGAIQNVDAEADFVVDRGQSIGDYVVINVGLQSVDSIEKYYITVIAR